MTTEPTPDPSPNSETLSVGATLWLGLGILAIAAVLFFALWSMEEQGGSMQMPWWLAAIYWIGGKWTVGIGMGAFGLLVLGAGVREWFSPTPKQAATPPALSRDDPTADG
jgi:hypothetical protein